MGTRGRRAGFAFALCTTIFVASPARAAVEGGAELDVVSRFVWRGRAQGRGAALQPSVWASTHDVTAAVWSNVALVDDGAGRRATAYVPSIVWERAFDAWTFGAGVFVEAGLDPHVSTTSEGALGVSVGGEHVRLSSDHRLDFGEARGAYFGDLALALEDDLFGFAFRARASIAWGDAAFDRAWFGVDRDAIDLASIEIALRRPLGAHFYVEPHAQLTALLPPIRAHVDEPTLVVAGIALGVEL